MGLKDDELKRLEIEERRRKYEEAERRRAELLAQNEAIKAQKAAAQSAQQTKKAAEGATVNSATAADVNASALGYTRIREGDNDMARVVANYGKETPDIAGMTYDQAMGFATRIVYDDERDDFLERWQKAHKDIAPTMDEMRKYLNSQKPGGVYQAAGAEYSKQIKENFKNEYAVQKTMHAFDGLTDVSGNAVNMNSAGMSDIIRAIRAEPNKARRKAYASAMDTLTKTPGSRFYGADFDKSGAEEFLNSAALTQSQYDRIVSRYESMFNPIAGHEQENVDLYAQSMEAIEAGGYDPYIKKAYVDALNDAYRSQLGVDTLPDLTLYTPPEEAQVEPEKAEKAQEKEKTDWLDKALEWGKEALDSFLAKKPMLIAGEVQFAQDATQDVRAVHTGEWQGPPPKEEPAIPGLSEMFADEAFMREMDTAKGADDDGKETHTGQWQGPPEKKRPSMQEALEDEAFRQAFDAGKGEEAQEAGEWQGALEKKIPGIQDALADEGFMREFIAKKIAEAEAQGEKVGTWQGPHFKSLFERSLEDGEYQAYVEAQLAKEAETKEVQGPPRAPMLGAEEDNRLPQFIDTIIEKYGAPDAARGMGGDMQESGTVDLRDDLGRAWFEYKEKGRFNELTKETQDALIALSREDGVKAWMGILGDSEFARFAAVNADGTTGQELNNEPAEFLYTENMGKLGPALMEIAATIYSDSFPQELKDDAFMAGAQLIQEANAWAKSAQFTEDMLDVHGKAYTTGMVNVYEEYIRIYGGKSEAARALSMALTYADDAKEREAEAQMLAAENEARSAAQNLEIAREAVRSGMYTQEQMFLVMENAPEMDSAARLADPMYRDLTRQLEDEWDFGTSEWMDEQVLAMAEALGEEYTAERAEWASREVAHSFLERVLRQKTDAAYALGYASLEEYAKTHGGITLDSLHNEAKLMMLRLGGSVDAVDMAIIEETKRYTGSGEGVTAGEIAYAAGASGFAGAAADPMEAFYNWMAANDLKRDEARVKATYDRDYGLFSETQLTHDLRAMVEGGYFPSEEMAQYVSAYLDAGGNPYELGLMPDDLQFVRKSAVALKQTKQAYVRWAERMLNEKQGMAFDIGSAIADNTTRMVLSSVVKGMSGSAFVGTLAGYGSGSFNEGASAVYGQDAQMIRETGMLPKTNTQRWANVAGIAQAMSTTVSEYMTFGEWSDNVGRLLGVNSAVRSGMGEIGTAGAMTLWSGAVKFSKAFAKQEFDEVFLDEMKEGILGEGADQLTDRLRALSEENALSPTTALAATLESIVGTAKRSEDILVSVLENAGMMALTVAPTAILGAGGDMRAAMPQSYRAAKRAAQTGSAQDTGRFIDALTKEVAQATPEQIAAADKAMHDVRVAEEAAVILTSDPEIDPVNVLATKAQEQADAHAVSERNSIAAAEAGRASAIFAQERMSAGEINPELVTQVANGVEAHAKNSQSALEHGREKEQKQLEADKAFSEGIKKAAAKAEANVRAREAAAANPPQEQADPAHNARVMEVNRYIEENYPGGVSDEQWQAIYDEFKADDDELSAGEETEPAAKLTKANVEFAAQIARKYRYEIAWDSDLEYGAEGKHIRGERKIVLNPEATQGEIIKRVLVHELTHGAEGTDAYADLENALIDFKYGSDTDQFTADVNSKRNTYRNTLAREFSEQEAKAEMVADICADLISGNDEMLNRLTAERPSVARRILDAIKGFIDKLRGVRDPEMENLKRIEGLLEKALGTSGKGQGEQYSLRWSKDGKRYVEIEEDILEGVPEDRWVKTVMDTLRDRFKDGIPVGNNIIRVTRKTRKEWSSSGDTKWFRHNDKRAYADKMRASGSADEIVQASGNYVNEKPVHSRTDGTVDFGRGNVLLSIGGNDYEAEVLMGSNPDGSVFLYDMLRMTPTSIQKKTHRPGSRRSVPRSRDASSDYSVHDGTSVVNAQSMQNREKYSLPSKNLLRQEVSAWRKARRAEAQREADDRKGERKFVRDTLQASRLMPAYIKDTLFNDPTSRYYERDSNDEQIIRAYQTIQQEGREAVTQRILTNRELPTKDDIAQANVLMAMAAQEGNMSTLLALSRHYAEDTTEVARALQAQKIFKRMTPIGMMQATAAQNEAMLSGWIEGHAPAREEAEANARRAEEEIADKDGRNPIALLESGEATITRENSKWGIPINERQAALIKKYKLEKVTRPGIHYNRATLKQRMLEAILATPDPLEATGGGLSLVTRLEYMKAGAPVVTNADLEYIGHQLSMYAAMDVDSQEDRIGQLALARAYEANANITQAGLVEKINGGRYINMLMNATSPIRNVMGNALMTGVNAASDSVATAIDSVVSLATGTHTKANLTPKEMIEGWEAFRQETVDTFRDYFVDQAIVKQGEGRFDVNRRGRIYQTGAAETARVLESFLMSVGDRNFWKMAYVNSMNEQMRAARKNGVELDYELARAQAEKDANYATFNEDNKVRDAMNALKNAGVFGKAIDLLMPFTGVPTNIVKRQLEYGPVGLAYTSFKYAARAFTKQTFDQRAFVEEMARGLTGTGLMALGFGLKQLGMIHSGAGEEEDYQAYYMRTARGDQYTPYITVGGQNVSLSTFAPAVSPILMGAAAYDALENDVGMMTALASAMSASLDSIIDASYFSAIQDILSGDGTFTENAVQSLLTSAATQSTPSILAHVASSMDPYVRDTKDKDWMKQTLNKAKARIPGLRETLPIKYDVTGEAVANTKQGWRALLDPFTTTEAEDDPAVNELIALYERTGETRGLTGYLISSNSYKLSVTQKASKAAGTGSEGYTMELTTDQKQAINQKYADILFNGEDGIRSLIESRRWQTMSDEERVDEIADMRSNAKLEATVWAIREYGW